MRTSITDRALASASVLAFCLAHPQLASGQTEGGHALLTALPAEARCSDQSAALGPSEGRAARAYVFAVGPSSVQLRAPTGQIAGLGPAPRELSVAFDSLGQPVALADEISRSPWHVARMVVRFHDSTRSDGFHEEMVADSAAIMARVEREGLAAGIASIPQTSRRTSVPLDSSELRRARELAELLWLRRCR